MYVQLIYVALRVCWRHKILPCCANIKRLDLCTEWVHSSPLYWLNVNCTVFIILNFNCWVGKFCRYHLLWHTITYTCFNYQPAFFTVHWDPKTILIILHRAQRYLMDYEGWGYISLTLLWRGKRYIELAEDRSENAQSYRTSWVSRLLLLPLFLHQY